jgi:DNA-binding NtrC family response regulator
MPDTRVLFMSGYTGASFRRPGRFNPVTNFIEKPFRVDGLLRMVRQVLDGE